jgi:predicted extracellular nuclease
MKKYLILFLMIFCFAGELDLMFWNAENLFDIQDDPNKKDGDFLPGGAKRYTYRSYCLKVQHLADVINYAKPDVLAMVEVENHKALEALCNELYYKDQWEILIDEGPDIRGIDPALIYRKDKVQYIYHTYYPVFIEERGYHSRPIMRVDLVENHTQDTISIFINHWPSRRGGKAVSDVFREYAASVLTNAVLQTLNEHPFYRIVMTGDFNDDRHDSCIEQLCKNNQMLYLKKELPKGVHGTYYHNGVWIHFDHFLVANFENASLYIKNSKILAPFWIREKETQGPLRFYKGMQTQGGYSDHYPILLKLGFNRKVVE